MPGAARVDRPILVSRDSLDDRVQETAGVHRATAFSDDHVWVGRVRDGPLQESGWHIHPGHDTYAHSVTGQFFVDFGLGGRERVIIEPGAFALIPKGLIHREGNPTTEPNEGIVFRVGSGPITVPLDGPES